MREIVDRVVEKLKKEPVVVVNFLTATIALLVVIGVPIPATLEGALVTFLVAGGTLFARSKVSPV